MGQEKNFNKLRGHSKCKANLKDEDYLSIRRLSKNLNLEKYRGALGNNSYAN